MGKKLTRRELMKQKRAERLKKNPESRTYEEKMNQPTKNYETVIGGDFDLFIPKGDTGKKYKGDIIPYVVGKNPSLLSDREEGQDGYVFMYKIHNLGNGDEEICLQATYGEKCPLCDELKNRTKNGEMIPKDEWKVLKPEKNAKCVYNWKCRSHEEEEEKGVQIWNIKGIYTEDRFDKLRFDEDEFVSDIEEGRGEILFYDVEEGRMISFDMTPDSFKTPNGKTIDYHKVDSVKFITRKYEITEEELESVYCLEDLVQLPRKKDGYIDFEAAYEKIKASFLGISGEKDIEEKEENNPDFSDEKEELKELLKDDSTWDEMIDLCNQYVVLSDIDPDDYADNEVELWEAISDKINEGNDIPF